MPIARLSHTGGTPDEVGASTVSRSVLDPVIGNPCMAVSGTQARSSASAVGDVGETE